MGTQSFPSTNVSATLRAAARCILEFRSREEIGLRLAAMESTALSNDQSPRANRDVGVAAERLSQYLAPSRRQLLFWVLQVVFWTSIGAIGLLMTLAFRSAVDGVGWTILMRVVVGFVGTSLLREVYRRPDFRNRSLRAKWPVAIFACLVLALVELVILKLFLVGGVSFPGGAETVGGRLVVVRIFILGVWSAFYFAYHLLLEAHAMELRTTRAELTSREHELRHLQAQMNPYFFLNALNGILAAKQDPVAVEEVTLSLSAYVRFLIHEAGPMEPLAQELDALDRYLTVRSSHLAGKLICRIQCGKEARAVLVPPLVVQPLLEDAFEHRSIDDALPMQIWVTARIEEGLLLITVSHTDPNARQGVCHPPGRAVIALEQRLELMLGPEAKLVRESDHCWIRATLHIPLPGK